LAIFNLGTSNIGQLILEMTDSRFLKIELSHKKDGDGSVLIALLPPHQAHLILQWLQDELLPEPE
jgi:hypothetical protein